MRSARAGFSFIEIVVALMIIAVMAVGAFSLMNWVKRAQRTSTDATLRNVQLAINTFNTDTGTYPTALAYLVTRPQDAAVSKKWRGPYADEKDGEFAVKDGWKNELQYHVNPKGTKRPYELFSWGPKGEESTDEERIHVWDLS
jgi:type II secretion system protein G